MKCSRSTACAFIMALIVANSLPAQFPNSPMKKPQNYSDYYQQHVQNYHAPPTNVRTYTIDKYYAQNPNLSPYLNLTRRDGGPYVNNYYQRVLPEVERRAEANIAAGRPTAPTPIPLPSNLPAVGPDHSAVGAHLTPTGPMSGYSKQFSKWYGDPRHP